MGRLSEAGRAGPGRAETFENVIGWVEPLPIL